METTISMKGLDPARARAFAEEWVAAWCAHDLERILSHYAESIELTSPLVLERVAGSDGTVRGRDALRAYFAQGLARAPQLRFELLEVLCGVRGLCIHYVNARGGRSAEYVELDERGKITRAIVCYT